MRRGATVDPHALIRWFALLLQPPMINHEAAILNDFDPGVRKYFGHCIVANSGLQPYCLRHFGQNIFDVRWNVRRTTKYVNEINIHRDVYKPPIDGFPENVRDSGIVNSTGII